MHKKTTHSLTHSLSYPRTHSPHRHTKASVTLFESKRQQAPPRPADRPLLTPCAIGRRRWSLHHCRRLRHQHVSPPCSCLIQFNHACFFSIRWRLLLLHHSTVVRVRVMIFTAAVSAAKVLGASLCCGQDAIHNRKRRTCWFDSAPPYG